MNGECSRVKFREGEGAFGDREVSYYCTSTSSPDGGSSNSAFPSPAASYSR